VVYGCLGGRPPALDWKSYVFRGLTVRGFNARAWTASNPARASKALGQMAALVAAGKLTLEFTEYDLVGEWRDAVEHVAGEEGGEAGGSKALLMMPGLPAACAGGGKSG
jgi:hypothetical protein